MDLSGLASPLVTKIVCLWDNHFSSENLEESYARGFQIIPTHFVNCILILKSHITQFGPFEVDGLSINTVTNVYTDPKYELFSNTIFVQGSIDCVEKKNGTIRFYIST